MADGLAWDDLPTELEGPGVAIRRKDFGGLAMCLIRLNAGVRTDPLFAGLPDDRCQCAHWGYIMSGTMRVHSAHGARDYEAGETYYWEPGHNLEAVTDAEYLEITSTVSWLKSGTISYSFPNCPPLDVLGNFTERAPTASMER